MLSQRTTRLCCCISVVWVTALIVMVLGAPPVAGQIDKPKLIPEPDKAAQAKSEIILTKMFKTELAKAKSEQAAARELAGVLLREARQTKDDPPLRFVALAYSRDLAAQAGDVIAALAAIDEMAKHFAVESLKLKAEALGLAAEKATSRQDYQSIVENSLNLVEEALAQDNYQVADALVKAAAESATKTQSLQIAARVEKRGQEVAHAKNEFGRLQKFLAALEKNPNDSAANCELGKYFCLVKGNWERGLPLLVIGGDKVFGDIAKRDLARPQEARAQMELGDDYSTFAEGEKGLASNMLLKRAFHWYVKCLPNLEAGLNKLRIEKTIQDSAKLFPASPFAPSATSSGIATLVRTFDKAHFNGIQVLAISPDSKLVLSGGIQEAMARVWQVSDGKQVKELKGHKNEIWGVAFSPDGTLMASASTDMTVRIWDVKTGNPRGMLVGHGDWVRGVHFLPDKARILTASDDKTLRMWELASGKTLKQISGHTNFINSLSVSKDGKRAATGSLDNTLRVWDLETGQEIANFSMQNEVWAVAIAPDGKKVAAAAVNSVCKIYDVDGKKELRSLPAPTRGWTVAFAPDGKVLAVGVGGVVNATPTEPIEGGWPQKGEADNSIYLFDADTGKAIRRLTGHTAHVRALAYSIDGRLLVSGGEDNMIRLWGEGKK